MIHRAEQQTTVRAPRPAVFAELGRYVRYAEWVPDVEQARLLVAEGDISVVEFDVPVAGPAPLVLEVVRTQDECFELAQIDQFGQHGLTGRFELADTAEGTQVTARLVFRGPMYRLRCARTLARLLERTLTALKERLAPPTQETAPGQRRRKLLEVTRVPGGLEVRLPGETLRLGPERLGGSR